MGRREQAATTAKGTGTETNTANTGNVVIIPETSSSPPNIKGRRRVVRTNAKAAL